MPKNCLMSYNVKTILKFEKELDNQLLVNRIHKTYLINEFAPESEKLKLKKTETLQLINYGRKI